MYKVVEMFDSIEGEGKRSGMPATFIRFAGCNLRCGYCDTAYALFGEKEECRYEELGLEELLSRDIKHCVTLTGGEPLIADGIAELTAQLLDRGHEINIETNGAVDIVGFLQEVGIYDEQKLFFTIDYKLPSSGMSDKMLWNNFENLMPYDVVKFVVGSDEDFVEMKRVISRMRTLYEVMPYMYAGCVYNEYDEQKLVKKLIEDSDTQDVRLQVQLHKIIWDADMRGV